MLTYGIIRLILQQNELTDMSATDEDGLLADMDIIQGDWEFCWGQSSVLLTTQDLFLLDSTARKSPFLSRLNRPRVYLFQELQVILIRTRTHTYKQHPYTLSSPHFYVGASFSSNGVLVLFSNMPQGSPSTLLAETHPTKTVVFITVSTAFTHTHAYPGR